VLQRALSTRVKRADRIGRVCGVCGIDVGFGEDGKITRAAVASIGKMKPLLVLASAILVQSSEEKRQHRPAGPALVREITAAAASAAEDAARRRRDPDGVAACAQPIPCRGLESTAQEGKTEGERLSRTAARAAPGRAELHPLSHRGGRGSSRLPSNSRCRRRYAALRRTPRLVSMSMLNPGFRRCAQLIAARRWAGVLGSVSAAARPVAFLKRGCR